jgi:hypothetical protein
VTAELPVILTVTIGNAQIGGNVVRWKGSQQILAKGNIENVSLGNGANIRGRVLRITTNVLDVNPSTNGVVINHYFHNAQPALFPFSGVVDHESDIYQLIADYLFT